MHSIAQLLERGTLLVGDVDDKGWVEGETPIEDFGMFMLLDEEISDKAAQRIFTALVGHQEGEEPEKVIEITNDMALFRPSYLPQVLTSSEFRIYSSLTRTKRKVHLPKLTKNLQPPRLRE